MSSFSRLSLRLCGKNSWRPWRLYEASLLDGGSIAFVLQLWQRQTAICDAADIRELSAATAPFQRHQPNFPRNENVNSAVSPVLPASHFSG